MTVASESPMTTFLDALKAAQDDVDVARHTREPHVLCTKCKVIGRRDRLAGNAAPELIALIEAAGLRRNVLLEDYRNFKGRWFAVPGNDFDALRAALDALNAKAESA